MGTLTASNTSNFNISFNIGATADDNYNNTNDNGSRSDDTANQALYLTSKLLLGTTILVSNLLVLYMYRMNRARDSRASPANKLVLSLLICEVLTGFNVCVGAHMFMFNVVLQRRSIPYRIIHEILSTLLVKSTVSLSVKKS